VTYWPEMPKSTTIFTRSVLKSATVRYFRRPRGFVAHKIHAPHPR
jgi:hypothetical protein